ncbi:MAG TPA: hypothetical protein DGG95_13625 [Cytophagales bacterium]|nr:hypothetical protein [Cytophagales bacterium]
MQNSILTTRGIQTAFVLRSEGQTATFSPIMKEVPSTNAFEDYLFDEHGFTIKEKTSAENRDQVQELAKKYRMTVRNKSWTGNISMNKDDYEDAGQIVPGYIDGKINEAVEDFAIFPDKLINDLLVANSSTFDGSDLFADTHNIGTAAAFDNKLAITGTTEANIRTDLPLAYNALISVQWADGKPINPLGKGKWYVLCPAHLELTFRSIVSNPQTSTGVANTWYNAFTPIVNPYQLTSVNTWYMVYYRTGREPFFLQRRKDVQWNYIDDKKSSDYEWISDARFVAAPAWFTSIVRIA